MVTDVPQMLSPVNELTRKIENDPDFTVIDETDDYIVVNKPAPLLVHPSVPGNPQTLLDGLQGLLAFDIANGKTLSIITRLDRETSGVVLTTKGKKAARRFSIAMQRREFTKIYRALVWGWPEADTFVVDEPIVRKGEFAESPIWLKRAIHPDGSPSRTAFRVIDRIERETTNGDRFSLIEARPHTGRMHQIRLHLAHAGHPIVGDKIYGPDERCYLEFIETGWTKTLAERLLLNRHALHAYELGLRELKWRADLPKAMVEIFR